MMGPNAAPVRQLLVFSSTPDVAADGFVVPLLADELPALAWQPGRSASTASSSCPIPMPYPSRR